VDDVADLAVHFGIDLTHPLETVRESPARNQVRFALFPREASRVRDRRHHEVERRSLAVAATNEILQLTRPDGTIRDHQVSLHLVPHHWPHHWPPSLAGSTGDPAHRFFRCCPGTVGLAGDTRLAEYAVVENLYRVMHDPV
jgi:hypothetical protein